jgi:hypothetical protein
MGQTEASQFLKPRLPEHRASGTWLAAFRFSTTRWFHVWSDRPRPRNSQRVLLKFCVDALDESGSVGVGPAGMLRSALTCFPASSGDTPWRLSASACVRISEIKFTSAATSEPSPGARWSGRTWEALRAAPSLAQQASSRCAAIAENIRHGLVLRHVARDQRSVGFHKSQLVAFGVRSAQPEQARCNPGKPKARAPRKTENTSTSGCSSTFSPTTQGRIMLSAVLIAATCHTRTNTPLPRYNVMQKWKENADDAPPPCTCDV